MSQIWNGDSLLTKKNTVVPGYYRYSSANKTLQYTVLQKKIRDLQKPYFVEGVPFEVHFHGIDHIDFSSNIEHLDLQGIQKYLFEEGIVGIPTIFLKQSKLNAFLKLMDRFQEQKQKGAIPNIVGIALEGPILLSQGGTPKEGSWKPSTREWEKLAACGTKGLKYMVISPDWNIKSLTYVAELFLSHGIYLSLGHSRAYEIANAVKGIYALCEIAKKMGFSPYSGVLTVDHFFNDMPQKIKHAWRSIAERRARSYELVQQNLDLWNLETLEDQIGDVPATLIKQACKGYITLFLNFDGQHVDLQICRRVYELVGAKSIVAMTDRLETNTFGNGKMKKSEIGSLWYQHTGKVAAGTSTLEEQMMNMRALDIPEKDIWTMCAINAERIFSPNTQYSKHKNYLSYVDSRNLRVSIITKNI